ncbi:MAG: tape measure protein, partial [Verrucomicrobiota bacterium]
MADAEVSLGWNNAEFKKGQREAIRSVAQFEKKTKLDVSGIEAAGLKWLGISAGAVGAAEAIGRAADALQQFANFQASVDGFEQIVGSSKEAAKEIAAIEQIAQRPGLSFKEALEGATNLRAVGFEAELSQNILANFGNALALVGKGKNELDGVILGLSQIASKGVVSAEEINQIAERVPQVRAVMQ